MIKATSSVMAILMAAGLAAAVDVQARERSVNERGANEHQGQQRERVAIGTRSGGVQTRERSVNERQSQQRERVATGTRSGEVNRPETRALRQDAQRIERKEQAFRSDGHFSRSERREVHRDLDQHGRQIHQARNDHDGRRGGNWGHGGGVSYQAPGWHGGRDWGHSRGGVDSQQQRQQTQIRQGVHNGSLTRHEARRLYGEQREIASLERRYRADGVLTGAERHDLRDELHDANRHIYNQSHDADVNYRR